MVDDALLEDERSLLLKSYFELIRNDDRFKKMGLPNGRIFWIVRNLRRHFRFMRTSTVTDEHDTTWQRVPLGSVEAAISMIREDQRLTPVREEVFHLCEINGIDVWKRVDQKRVSEESPVTLGLIALLSSTFFDYKWTTLQFEIFDCASKELLNEAERLFQNAKPPSTTALMGKVVGTWKRLRDADVRDCDHLWHSIETVMKGMIEQRDPVATWSVCLSKATPVELEQMLEFLENIK